MPGDIQVAVTREGALGALKLLMIVLAGVIFWESGIGINAGVQRSAASSPRRPS